MKLHHIALKSSDIEKTLAFYTAIGMHEVAEWGEGKGRTVMLDVGDGTRLEIFANGGDEFPPRGKWLHLALASEDVDASYAAALAAGATALTPPKTVDIPTAKPAPLSIRIAFVKGPDGEEVEFFAEV